MWLRRMLGLAAVVVATAAAAPPAQAATTTEVVIQGFAYNPTPVTIAAGDSIRWVNNDFAEHTATLIATSPPQAVPPFDTGTLSNGESATIAFTTPGTYEYYCLFHQLSMQARLVVTAGPDPVVPESPFPALLAASAFVTAGAAGWVIMRRRPRLA